jgi:hypothetical protein
MRVSQYPRVVIGDRYAAVPRLEGQWSVIDWESYDYVAPRTDRQTAEDRAKELNVAASRHNYGPGPAVASPHTYDLAKPLRRSETRA